ncbi:MAG TPA: aldo/keto reductase [Candidatus Eubacterium avistercoris]|uniref:Aldo/keto reductase n=1 Tax=Candidatus Eubacterium avistercoris TaxID=2838567 RepID=A0A9D2D2B9_9FIRM|nr:aldo/keto reductase [Candidatus Eubacterium avistercoris]
MERIKLYNGVSVPMEGFGVFQVPEQDCEQVVRNAVKAGYRLIDTASSYQNEEAVGRGIRDCGVAREELFITTKAYIQEMGYDRTMEAFERSRKKLGLEYLDLYLIHMPFGDYYGSWRALEELYRAGKVRAIGVCNFTPDRLLDLCCNVQIRPQINQIERHPHYQRAQDLQLMKELGVQPEAWAPFAEGLKGMFCEPALLRIGKKHGKTPAQVILRWNVQQGLIVISKTVHRERMKENLEIWDFELDPEDMEQIAKLDKGCPSMLDTRKVSEVRRVYDYLNNPVLTSL